MLKLITIASALVCLSLAGPAKADDISDAINDAQKAYKSGDLNSAKQALDLASQLIAQKNAEGLVKAFPKPLSGWTARDADTSTNAFAAMTGSHASRRYTKGNNDSVTINIAADGPILAQMITMLANPQMAGMMGKIIRIGDQRGIQERDGDITILVANRFIVKIEGSAKVEDLDSRTKRNAV
jgi:hypothetical protein